ncbi:leucine carboxyl methyltransferase [Piromyces finnis]|uniref:Leucine carboxyl methyltransferase 1 n=1 Tax=Piromyces finnis TaxID=1754191 RepID=A0A1Y1UVQ0_9FUNG|nr:leucine carboxyl methyltransferase [Piromyces finnis]|eukprot:ORX42060.1 leucine carboxyl methyltransferase [Piromyces finnis]
MTYRLPQRFEDEKPKNIMPLGPPTGFQYHGYDTAYGSMGDSAEDAVRGTNDSAVESRCSAVNLGYFKDEFVKFFTRRTERRPPIINRGSYARFMGFDIFINKFLEAGDMKKQIVVLGAGSDTKYFNLKKENKQPYKFFEIDFPQITFKKIQTIKRSKQISGLIGDFEINIGHTELYGQDYYIISEDLKNFTTKIVPKLEEHGFDKNLPTMFLSECVMIYMDPEHSDAIVQWISENVPTSLIMAYEQILPNDAFGQMMIKNLKARNIELKGIDAYPDLEDQKNRYLSRGWDQAFAININYFFNSHIDPSEYHRQMLIEIFDEIEEWKLIAQHYCFAWAFNMKNEDYKFIFDDIKFPTYSLSIPKHALPKKISSNDKMDVDN